MMVILVDKNDQVIGYGEKLEVHKKGLLHRAFSIFIFNSRGEILLQKRSSEKYHSPTLWSNACCSHPSAEETMESSAHRRLQEEMGIQCSLEHLFSFIYRAELENSMIEHEVDHVFLGRYDGPITPNPKEVEEFKWMKLKDLSRDINQNPDKYTEWLKIILSEILDHYLKEIG
jgi:isopentenyl-diphosphate delta-isomerase